MKIKLIWNESNKLNSLLKFKLEFPATDWWPVQGAPRLSPGAQQFICIYMVDKMVVIRQPHMSSNGGQLLGTILQIDCGEVKTSTNFSL